MVMRVINGDDKLTLMETTQLLNYRFLAESSVASAYRETRWNTATYPHRRDCGDCMRPSHVMIQRLTCAKPSFL